MLKVLLKTHWLKSFKCVKISNFVEILLVLEWNKKIDGINKSPEKGGSKKFGGKNFIKP